MNLTVLYRILEQFGIASTDVVQILPTQMGYRNHSFPIVTARGDSLNLIIYKNEPDILRKVRVANHISDYLAEKGFPTRQTQRNSGRSILKIAKRIACLYNYLPGETIPWEAYTKRHIKLLGQELSDIHHALQDYRQLGQLHDERAEQAALLQQIDSYLSDTGVATALAKKLHLTVNYAAVRRLSDTLTALKQSQHLGVLHMDFVRSNVLFTGAGTELKISGVLDFEKASYGPLIVDIARTLAFLVVDCKYKLASKVSRHFLHSGYDKRGKLGLPQADLQHLQKLLEIFWLHDFYKFLSHNPYESLPRNEHFRRTLAQLLKAGLIS